MALICPVLTGLGGFLRPDSRWLGRASAAGGVGGRSFEANGLRPLSFAAVTHHHEPASQPLLLLMPAIYDAQAARVDAALNQADLYERLLSRFA